MSLHDLIPADLRPEAVARLTAGETVYLNVACVCVPYWPVGHPDRLCTCLPAWVELAGATCGTCGMPPATDCHRGKPIHTISVPCEHPNARTICGVPGDGDDWICDDCGADDGSPDGTVEVEAIVRKVLPARHVLDPIDDSDELVIAQDRRTWHKGTEIAVTGPQPVPGDHIPIIEAVRS